MKNFLAAIFTFFASAILAQSNFVEGVITKVDGETIAGQIDYREWVTNPRQIRFRTSANDETQTYGVNDLSEFKINYKNEIYRSAIVYVNNEPVELNSLLEFVSVKEINRHVALDRDSVFLLVLAKGRLNLFMLLDERNKHHYFIQKDGGDIEELIYRQVKVLVPAQNGSGLLQLKTINDYKNQLTLATQECPSVNKSIQKVFYSYSILKIVEQYNQCVGQSSYIRPKDRTEHRFYAFAGGGRSFITFKDFYNLSSRSMSAPFTPTVGLGFDLGLLRTNNRLSIGLEANYMRTQVEFSTLRDKYNGTFENVGYRIDIPGIRFNSLAKYIVFPGKVEPYVQAGIGLSVYFNTKYVRTKTDTPPIPPTATERNLNKSELYAIGCLGLRVSRFFIEGRYELGTDINRVTDEDLKMNRLSVVVGYSLKLNKRSRQ